MSQLISFEMPDDVYAAIKYAADSNAQTLDEWLLVHLQELLPPIPNTHAPNDMKHTLWTEEEEAQFAAEEAAFDAEWQQYLVDVQAMQHRPHPTEKEARDHVLRVLKTWSPTYLPHHEALELAMSKEIAEWNLDLD